MVLLSSDLLYGSGLPTRGPADRPCSSNAGCSSWHSVNHNYFRSRLGRQGVSGQVVYRSSSSSTSITIAPAKSISNAAAMAMTDEQASGQAPRAKVLVSYYEETDASTVDNTSPQQQRTGTGVLKINMDLMLFRCRTARIRAQTSINAAERKALMRSAEEGLRRCLVLDPTDARGYVVLGKLLVLQKRYDEARALYQEGCSITGNTNPYMWSAWGWLEYRVANYDRARKLYDAATVVDPTHACAWHKWGMLEKEQGNYTRARDLWMQGIQRCRRKPQSQNAYLYNALGVMAAQLGRLGEARAWFEEGTRSAEGAASVALWQAWAVLEAKQGDPSAVRYLFKKSLTANPRSRYTHLAWALWERRMGNMQQCLLLLQRGCSLNPTDPALYQAWALMERERGHFDRARALFEAGLKADPSNISLYQAWGIMEAALGNVDRARGLFQQGVWSDPRARSVVYIFHAWGVLELRNGDSNKARELFRAALRVDPKSETVWSTWIAMEEELGLLQEADELRIRRGEQQWEFVVPAGFTTRPEASPLQGLGDMLSRFFRLRSSGAGGGAEGQDGASWSSMGAYGASAAAGPVTTSSGRAVAPGSGLASMLPSDFQENMSPDDVLSQLEESTIDSLMMPALGDDGVEANITLPSRVSQGRSQEPDSATVPYGGMLAPMGGTDPEDERLWEAMAGVQGAAEAAQQQQGGGMGAARSARPAAGRRRPMGQQLPVPGSTSQPANAQVAAKAVPVMDEATAESLLMMQMLADGDVSTASLPEGLGAQAGSSEGRAAGPASTGAAAGNATGRAGKAGRKRTGAGGGAASGSESTAGSDGSGKKNGQRQQRSGGMTGGDADSASGPAAEEVEEAPVLLVAKPGRQRRAFGMAPGRL